MEPSEESPVAVDARLSGRVQGVGFRYGAYREARRLGIVGRVRNEPDGSVSVHAEGDRRSVERFAEWLRTGPPGARVDAADIRRVEPQGLWRSFVIEP